MAISRLVSAKHKQASAAGIELARLLYKAQPERACNINTTQIPNNHKSSNNQQPCTKRHCFLPSLHALYGLAWVGMGCAGGVACVAHAGGVALACVAHAGGMALRWLRWLHACMACVACVACVANKSCAVGVGAWVALIG